MQDVWDMMQEYFYLITHGFSLNIHTFVLMSNHYHLIASAPEGNLGEAMGYHQRETSRESGRLTGRINHLWGGRIHKVLIGSPHHFMNTYKYVLRNPVRAGICDRAEEYPFSTLHGLLGKSHLLIPLVEDTLLFSPELNTAVLEWINMKSAPELEEEMRLALRRPIFELAARGPGRKPSRLETELL